MVIFYLTQGVISLSLCLALLKVQKTLKQLKLKDIDMGALYESLKADIGKLQAQGAGVDPAVVQELSNKVAAVAEQNAQDDSDDSVTSEQVADLTLALQEILAKLTGATETPVEPEAPAEEPVEEPRA